MKSLSHIALALALLLGIPVAAAQSGIRNPMTQAVLAVYEEELRANPNNYEVLMNRAEEYYRHEEYIRALDDISRALTVIPASESETVLHARLLRAGIYNMTHRSAIALADLEEANRLQPNNFTVLLQKANTEVLTGDFTAAKDDYRRANRLNPRSSEVYIGLARVAVQENNLGLANEMLESAVNLNPTSAESYIQRAMVRKSMGNHNGAVDDLILAMSFDSENRRAMRELLDYGDTNYAVTIAGLTSAISKAPRIGMYRYLRAGIAQAHFHYLAALQDYRALIDEHIYNYHGIYASMAQCQFALGMYDEALNNIDYALGMLTSNTCEYYALRSRIQLALGNAAEAERSAYTATVADRDNNSALTALAMAYVANGRYDDASALLGEATLNDAEDPLFPMLRGWVLEKLLNNPSGARQQYQRVADMDCFYIDNPRSLKGFALLKLGETDAAKRWMQNILTTVEDRDGLLNYYGCCFYTQLDNYDKALECAAKALDLGYADYYQWTDYSDGYVNMGALRDDLRFLNLLNRHNAMFGRE